MDLLGDLLKTRPITMGWVFYHRNVPELMVQLD
jgi:hypothetical protein